MAKGGNTSGASTAAGVGASVGTSNAATNSATATNAAGNPGSAAAAQAAAAQANAAAANAANSGKGSESSGGISVNIGSNNAAVHSGNVTASYDNAGSLSGRGYASSTSGWGGGYGAAAAMDGLTTATQRGEDGRVQASTAGGFGSGYATSSSKAAPTYMGSVFAGLGPVGSALANATNAVTGGSLNSGTYYGRVDGSGYYGPASTGDESSTTNAISNLGAATPAAPTSPAATSPAATPSIGSAATDAVSSGIATGLDNASNTNSNNYSSGANSGTTYRGGTVTDSGSGGSISSGITPPSRDSSSIGLGVYNPDKANYDQDSWNRGMEVQSSSLVSDEECKAFAKRAFSENTEPFKKVRVTIIKKV